MTWQEDSRTPDVIFEFLSPSTRGNDLGKKKRLYEQTFKTEEYFCFDYFKPFACDSLKGFRLIAGRYQPIQPNEKGWLWSEKLGLWVGTWPGTYKRDQSTWMRFYTKEGDLVLMAAEAQEQRAEAEKQRADFEQQRAEAEKQQAEAEKQRAEAAEEELARLKALLAKQGVDLDT